MEENPEHLIEQKEISSKFREGMVASLPIFIGYIPVAITFGLLAKSTGLTLWETFLFSALVFAGASQFMALQLIQGGAEPAQIIIATLIMNFRHFLMSSHLSTIFPIKEKPWLIPFLSFGVTDESFAYFSTSQYPEGVNFILGLEYSAYASWVGGTVIGYLFGNILPPILQASMGIALYALFIALLIPEAKKSLPVALTAIIGGVAHSFLSWLRIFSSGWNIIMAILIAASVSAWIIDEEEENE